MLSARMHPDAIEGGAYITWTIRFNTCKLLEQIAQVEPQATSELKESVSGGWVLLMVFYYIILYYSLW